MNEARPEPKVGDIIAEQLIASFSRMAAKKKTRNVVIAGNQTYSIEDLREHADRVQQGDRMGVRTGELMHVLIDAVDDARTERQLREAKQEAKDMRDDITYALRQLKELLASANNQLTSQNRQRLVDTISELEASIT